MWGQQQQEGGGLSTTTFVHVSSCSSFPLMLTWEELAMIL
jgi:hypothetical protein